MSKILSVLAIFCFLMVSVSISFADPSIPNASDISKRLSSNDPIIRLQGVQRLAEAGEVALPWINIQLSNLTKEQGRFGDDLIMALNQMPGLTSDMVYNSMSPKAQKYIKMKAQTPEETNGPVAARSLIRKLDQ